MLLMTVSLASVGFFFIDSYLITSDISSCWHNNATKIIISNDLIELKMVLMARKQIFRIFF